MNDTAITLQQDYGLPIERQTALIAAYQPFMAAASEYLTAAGTITVADETDTAMMKTARTTRLALKAIRVDVEKTRKSLKANALREGKAIDGMANVIKYIIVPVEESLQEQEDIVRLADERRKAALAQERIDELSCFSIDCQYLDLANMPETAYEALLQSSATAYSAHLLEAERVEHERVKMEKAKAERLEAERIERERIAAENAALRQQVEATEKKRAVEQAARELAEHAQRTAEKEKIKRENDELTRQRQYQRELKQAEEDRLAAITQANEQKQLRAEAEAVHAETERRYAAMACRATCPECGHVFDAQQ